MQNTNFGLINPRLIKSNLLIDSINIKPPEPIFNYSFKTILINLILPLVIIITLAIILKKMYKEKQKNKKKVT